MIDRSRKAPMPYFGGKSAIADAVWQRFGSPAQYIEPMCGSAAVLLAAPRPASLEVIGDSNYFVANLWRCIKFQPDLVWAWQDYPVSHIDLYARHRWLTEPARTAELRASLLDPDWPGDPKIAGWWLWGQCCWIGSGWCDPHKLKDWDQIPDVSQTGRGDTAPSAGAREHGKIPAIGRGTGRCVQSATAQGAAGLGQVPHAGNAGMGVQAVSLGKVPHASNAGMGAAAHGQIPFLSSVGMDAHADGAGDGVLAWLRALAARLARVRVVHGDWSRCLNHHYGGVETAVFLDPPYKKYEALYSSGAAPVADAVCEWAREHQHLRIALCGHRGDYDLPGWEVLEWSRGRLTYGGGETTDLECIWFSPSCLGRRQGDLFASIGPPDQRDMVAADPDAPPTCDRCRTDPCQCGAAPDDDEPPECRLCGKARALDDDGLCGACRSFAPDDGGP